MAASFPTASVFDLPSSHAAAGSYFAGAAGAAEDPLDGFGALSDGDDDDEIEQADASGGPKRRSRRGPTTIEKRATHNAVERARRNSLNGRFMDLARLLPNMPAGKRASKNAIVSRSLEFVGGAVAREAALGAENARLRAEVAELRGRLGLSPPAFDVAGAAGAEETAAAASAPAPPTAPVTRSHVLVAPTAPLLTPSLVHHDAMARAQAHAQAQLQQVRHRQAPVGRTSSAPQHAAYPLTGAAAVDPLTPFGVVADPLAGLMTAGSTLTGSHTTGSSPSAASLSDGEPAAAFLGTPLTAYSASSLAGASPTAFFDDALTLGSSSPGSSSVATGSAASRHNSTAGLSAFDADLIHACSLAPPSAPYGAQAPIWSSDFALFGFGGAAAPSPYPVFA